MLVEFKRGDDMGSNLMRARFRDSNQKTGYITQLFKGYESQNREPFTPEDIQEFLVLLLNHPKFKRYTWIIIEMLGSATFDELDLVKQSETIPVPKIAKRKT